MGCDIYALVEYRDRSDNRSETKPYWFEFGEINLSRRYQYFSALAGVRSREGEPECLFPPKGIPEDSDYDEDHWLARDGGLHSHSYLSLVEIEKAFSSSGLVLKELNDDWLAMIEAMRALSVKNEVRLVFGFD